MFSPEFTVWEGVAWQFVLPGSSEISFAALGSFLLLSGQEETSVFGCIIIVVSVMPTGEGGGHRGIKEWNKCPDGRHGFL